MSNLHRIIISTGARVSTPQGEDQFYTMNLGCAFDSRDQATVDAVPEIRREGWPDLLHPIGLLIPQHWEISGVRVTEVEDGWSSGNDLRLTMDSENRPRITLDDDLPSFKHELLKQAALLAFGEAGDTVGDRASRLLLQMPADDGPEVADASLDQLLAYWSTLPTPVGQALNVSHCFRYNAQQQNHIVFAPVFTIDGVTYTPDTTLTELGSGFGHWVWPYTSDSGTGLTFSALVRPLRTTAKPNGSQIDLSTQWVKTASGQPRGVFTENWLTALESNLATSFDLAQRLIDAFRNLWKVDEFRNAVDVAKMRRAILVSLRDQADMGFRRRSDSLSLFDELVMRCRERAVETGVDPAIFRSMVRVFKSTLIQYDRMALPTWQKILVVHSESDPPLIRDPDEPAIANRIEDEFAEWEAVQADLCEDESLRKLVQTQWRDAIIRPFDIHHSQVDSSGYIRDREFFGEDYFDAANVQIERAFSIEFPEITVNELAVGTTCLFRFQMELSGTPSQPLEVELTAVPSQAENLSVSIRPAGTNVMLPRRLRMRLDFDAIASGVRKARISFPDTNVSAVEVDGLTGGDPNVKVSLDFPAGRPPAEQPESAIELVRPLFTEDGSNLPVDAAGEFWDRFGEVVSEELLRDYPFKKRLSRGVLNSVWSYLISNDDHEPLNVRLLETVPNAIESYFMHRLVDRRYSGPGNWPIAYPETDIGDLTADDAMNPLSTDLLAYVREELRRYATDLIGARLLPSDWKVPLPNDADEVDEGGRDPTQTAHGVTVQVNSVTAEPPTVVESDSNANEDPLEQISGLGVLMRTTGNAWRCLTMAKLRIAGGAFQSTGKHVLVPMRLAYQNGVSAATFTYDNHPLTCKSPAVADAQTRNALSAEVTLEEQNEGSDSEEVFEYANAYLNEAGDRDFRDWRRLPPLRFGNTYEIAAFAIGTGGALPYELRDPGSDHPATLIQSPIDSQGAHVSVPMEHVHRFAYLRRVRVGQVRVERLRIDETPSDVMPLASEVPIYEPPIELREARSSSLTDEMLRSIQITAR